MMLGARLHFQRLNRHSLDCLQLLSNTRLNVSRLFPLALAGCLLTGYEHSIYFICVPKPRPRCSHGHSYGLLQSAAILLATCNLAAEGQGSMARQALNGVLNGNAKQIVALQVAAILGIIQQRSILPKLNDVWQ